MMMRRRLYFLLPDVESARAILNEMLLARIEIGRMHFLGKRGQLPPDLPEASFLQKTDFVHGAQLGLGIGGLAGIVVGLLVVAFPPGGASLQLVTVLIAAIVGALFGAWASSMAASAVPNSKLRRFHAEIERGKVLMMVDVPMGRVREISDLVARRHPAAVSGGFEPTIPAFP
jgi:membrane protein implicated in regulation of membrane protease activity